MNFVRCGKMRAAMVHQERAVHLRIGIDELN
jgi:hypothetical protein